MLIIITDEAEVRTGVLGTHCRTSLICMFFCGSASFTNSSVFQVNPDRYGKEGSEALRGPCSKGWAVPHTEAS